MCLINGYFSIYFPWQFSLRTRVVEKNQVIFPARPPPAHTPKLNQNLGFPFVYEILTRKRDLCSVPLDIWEIWASSCEWATGAKWRQFDNLTAAVAIHRSPVHIRQKWSQALPCSYLRTSAPQARGGQSADTGTLSFVNKVYCISWVYFSFCVFHDEVKIVMFAPQISLHHVESISFLWK